MYINTFKYRPEDVSCKLCTEYVKKLGCTALRCPWLAERIEAGVVGYREAITETFPHDRRLSQRFSLLIKHFSGSLWGNVQHQRRMEFVRAVQKYRRSRDTSVYYAAMYLLTANDDIYRRTANCFCRHGIEFGYVLYYCDSLQENIHVVRWGASSETVFLEDNLVSNNNQIVLYSCSRELFATEQINIFAVSIPFSKGK